MGLAPTASAARAMVSGAAGSARSMSATASTICSRENRGGRPRRGGASFSASLASAWVSGVADILILSIAYAISKVGDRPAAGQGECVVSEALQGRVALVTGASKNIGKGIALEVAASGAVTYVTARSVEDVPGRL